MTASTDRNVQMAALSWQMEAVPAMRQSLYQPDPITAAVDALVLCNQMADYFHSGAGRQAMGAASAQCADTCKAMADDLAGAMAATTKSGDIPKLRAFARQWAVDHPIRGSIAERESAVARMSDFLSAEGLSTGETIAEVTTTLDDMNRKLEVYSEQLPRQARWEAERMKLQLNSELRLDQMFPLAERATRSLEQAVKTIDHLSPALDRSLKVAEDVPAIVASQRETAMKGVDEEVTRTMQFARQERLAVISDLSTAMVEQRKQVGAEANVIAAKQIDYAVQQITRLIALAMAAALLIALLGVLLARRLPQRRRAPAEPHRMRIAHSGTKTAV